MLGRGENRDTSGGVFSPVTSIAQCYASRILRQNLDKLNIERSNSNALDFWSFC